MKKLALIFLTILILTLALTLSACEEKDNDNLSPDTSTTKEDVITIEDGYLVVNGVKTEHKVDDGKEPEVKEDIITVEDGYVVVNGVKTDIFVPDCAHSWVTVTTNSTCTAGGYDTKTCTLCGKSVIANETAKLDHTYSTTYSFDDNYHWFKCTNCSETSEREMHTPDADDNCTVCDIPLSATPGVVYDISADGTYAEVIGYAGAATKVKIASEYQGLPVKNIYREAFYNRTITSVIIPDTVTSIGDSAFCSCTSLTSVVIPDSVTSIGGSAFESCTSLTSVVIPDSVTSISGYAFYNCESLTSVVIPDSVTSIGGSAFFDCHSSLYTEYEFGKYVRSGDNPYAVLIEITNKNMSTYTIHEDTKHIARSAFASCSRLTSITIPDSVTSIGDQAFYYCTSLTSVVIGDSVTSIGDEAFYYCTSLTSVVIGDSVTSIGGRAFYYCTSLTSINFSGTVEEWNAITKGKNWDAGVPASEVVCSDGTASKYS